ncbi:MAG: hypothetical protein ACJ8LM_16630, partial [Candidatus Udaeobacter sp.]
LSSCAKSLRIADDPLFFREVMRERLINEMLKRFQSLTALTNEQIGIGPFQVYTTTFVRLLNVNAQRQ